MMSEYQNKGDDVPPRLHLDIDPVVLLEHGGDYDNVVDDDNPFDVVVKWKVTPPTAAVLLTGTWTVRVYVESIGPGPEKLIGTEKVAADGGRDYQATLTIPKGTLPSDAWPEENSGVYKVVAVLTYATSLKARTVLTAFATGPYFLIRTP
jgi:hypothetical protein